MAKGVGAFKDLRDEGDTMCDSTRGMMNKIVVFASIREVSGLIGEMEAGLQEF